MAVLALLAFGPVPALAQIASGPGSADLGEEEIISYVDQWGALKERHRGILLMATRRNPETEYDIPVISARDGLERVREALDALIEKSPFNAKALEVLMQRGKVSIIYDTGFPRQSANSASTILAGFVRSPFKLPRSAPKTFPAVVGRYIVKWSLNELTAALAHELLGHGKQHLRGDLMKLGPRNRECEASLYEEQVYQDLGVDKRSRNLVAFRKKLEWRYCSAFKRYMKKADPSLLELWNSLNPDVPRLLEIFEGYARTFSEP